MSTRTVSIDSRVFGELRGPKKSTSITKGKSSDSDKKSSSSSGVSSRSDLHELISKIESMKNLRQVPIKNLEKKKQQELQDLRSAAMLLRKGKNYGLVVDAIHKNFSQTNDLQPGTVGAFFIGCFMENNDDGCLSCSAFCAGSMPVPPTPGWKDCDKSVAIYSEGQLNVRQVNETSDEILVHIIDDNFEGFSESDVRKLKGMGVQKVTISSATSTASTGKSTQSASGTPESLSRKTLHSSEECSDESTPVSSASSQSYKQSEESCSLPCNEGGWGGMAVVGVIVFIILLLIIAAVAYYYFAGASTPAQTTVVSSSVSSTAGFFGPGYKCM